ncbi:ribosome assembly RNA-binding protein YhbY [Candidatus Woesearchaeota archaeon]|nr:ribosome assembly RNA-binding protein YhbY [Candidatus Woesearchaeota archaeon]
MTWISSSSISWRILKILKTGSRSAMTGLCTTTPMIKMEIKELRKKAANLKPNIRIGKAGLTPQALKEIESQLKKKKLVKVRFLKPAAEGKEQHIKEMISRTGAVLIRKIGSTAALYKSRH